MAKSTTKDNKNNGPQQNAGAGTTQPAASKTKGRSVAEITMDDLQRLAQAKEDLGANNQSLRIQVINFAQAYQQFHGFRNGVKVTDAEDKRVQDRAAEAANRAREAVRIYLREMTRNIEAIYEVLGE